jgi:hypothetical protein
MRHLLVRFQRQRVIDGPHGSAKLRDLLSLEAERLRKLTEERRNIALILHFDDARPVEECQTDRGQEGEVRKWQNSQMTVDRQAYRAAG